MTDKEKLLEKTMKNTRSVLLPNREGLLSDAFPYKRLGFVSAMELIKYMDHQDVVSVDRLPSGHILLKGIPDKNTEHVSRMVKNQRRNEEGYNRRTAQIIRQQGPGFRKHIERSQVTEAAREVPKHTKAVVEDMMLEHEDGLAVADFCRAFHEKEGYRIEFMSWGFLNLEDFLYYGLGDIVDLSPVDGHYGIEWILFPKHHAGRTPSKLDNQYNSKDKIARDGGVCRFKARQKEFKNEEEVIGRADQKVISADSVKNCNLIVTEHMKSNIKRVLMKHPNGVAYQKFRRAYLDTNGNNLEVKSLESFFNSPGISDMVQLKQEAGKVVVMPSNILPH